MGRLAELLNQPKTSTAETAVAYDQSGKYSVTSSVPQTPDGMLQSCGLSPDTHSVVGEVTVRSRELADSRTLFAYTFKAQPRTDNLDVDWLRERARTAPKHESVPRGEGVWVFQASDLQLGKVDGYGVDGTVDRYYDSLDRAEQHLAASGPVKAIHLVFAGDCIENGGVSQGGKLAWRQILTITQQVRLWRRLLMETVRRFAPLSDEVHVSVVGGNHDDATRSPVQTRADDNWATEGAIAVADQMLENKAAFGHVQMHIPEVDCGYMTANVHDTSFTIAHGHQWRKGKAAEWWASQAFYLNAPGKSHFLLHGHWHSLSLQQDGPRTIVCSPTYDGGSAWYRDLTGAHSDGKQGGLAYVVRGSDFEGLRRV